MTHLCFCTEILTIYLSDTVKHTLLDCIDLRDTRIKYYRNISNLKDLLYGNIKVICNYLKECGLFYKF